MYILSIETDSVDPYHNVSQEHVCANIDNKDCYMTG